MIRVILPTHLRGLASIDREVELDLEGPTSLAEVMDALEHALSHAARDDPRSQDKRKAGVYPILRLRRGPVAHPSGGVAS